MTTGFEDCLRGSVLSMQASPWRPPSGGSTAPRHDWPEATQRPAGRDLRILVAHDRIPRPDVSGGDKQLWQVLRAFRQLGHSVTLLGLRGGVHGEPRVELEAMGIDVHVLTPEQPEADPRTHNSDGIFHRVLTHGRFDLAVLTLWFWNMISVPELLMDGIRRLSPGTRISIMTDDCHWLRQLRLAEVSGRWSDRERSSSLFEREKEIYRRADQVISISSEDLKNLGLHFPGIPVVLLPMYCELGPPGPEFDARRGLVYLADYQNLASRDAIEWFLADIWPRILSRLPNLGLYLIGSSISEHLGGGARNVIRVGYVQELGPELGKYRVFISPVRWGTGIKTKNLHALANGLPLVTTTVGAEGMHLEPERSALIADSAGDFANAVIRAYEDRALWETLAVQGRAHIASVFSEDNTRQRAAEAIDQAFHTTPRSHEPGHIFSVRLVEQHLASLPARPVAGGIAQTRLIALSRLAEKLADAGDREEARRQVQHIFSLVNWHGAADLFYRTYGPVVDRIERVYRRLGDPKAAEAMRAEAQGRFHPPAQASPASAEVGPPRRQRSSHPLLSVVMPTCNRQRTLADCLSALSRQQISARQFEVIVVDDGSTDATADFCQTIATPFALHYLRQENAGAGAARRRGVEQARGDYLLLMNDDTIAEPDLLLRHRSALRRERGSKVAVLGNFEYPTAARSRALTYYLSVRPFLFPMMNMKAGLYSNPMFFITCNLSLPRQDVIEAGSFDPDLRVGEDTDLGIRLVERGFQIVYEPEARAVHQHLDFTAEDLVRRARVYAPAQFRLIRKHPCLLGDGKSPFGRMDAAAARHLERLVESRRRHVPDALRSIRQFDHLDFERFWSIASGQRAMAEEIVNLFSVAVPEVYFFHFYRAFLEVWQADGSFPAADVEQDALAPAAGR